MKTLYLLRHAKSSWDNPGLSDINRPLSNRGKRALKFMAQAGILLGKEEVPIWSSPAERARTTIEGIIEHASSPVEVNIDDRLYTFSASTLLEWLAGQSDKLEAVMIVGHNPAMEELVSYITAKEIDKYPTGAYACLSLNINSWADITPGCGSQDDFIRPKK